MDTAIQCIYRDLEYAKSLIKPRAGLNAEDGRPTTVIDEGEEEENEESWTFVGGDEPDPEFFTRKLSATFAGLTIGAPIAMAGTGRQSSALGDVTMNTGTITTSTKSSAGSSGEEQSQ